MLRLFRFEPTRIDTSGDHTAILFFSHRPECEWQNKQFVRQDYAAHRQVAEVLFRHSRRAVHESGFPVLEVTSARQRGEGFGERLANAFADAFAEGYEHVIAIGSDCPHVDEVDWSAVAARLSRGRPVLGPTSDREGAYLIGLSRKQFDRARFEALPWQSPALFSALARYLSEEAQRPPRMLAVRDDVNDQQDLLTLVRDRSGSSGALVVRLRAILGESARGAHSAELISRRRVTRRRSRAPPFRIHLRAGDDVPASAGDVSLCRSRDALV